jgi:hypothetical protein
MNTYHTVSHISIYSNRPAWRRDFHHWLAQSLDRKGCVESAEEGFMYADCIVVVLMEVEVGTTDMVIDGADDVKDSLYGVMEAAAGAGDGAGDGDEGREAELQQYCTEVLEWYVHCGRRAKTNVEMRWRRRVPQQKLRNEHLQRHLHGLTFLARECEPRATGHVNRHVAGQAAQVGTKVDEAQAAEMSEQGENTADSTADGAEEKKARKLQKKQEARERRAMKKQIRATKAKVKRAGTVDDGEDEKKPKMEGLDGDFGALSI